METLTPGRDVVVLYPEGRLPTSESRLPSCEEIATPYVLVGRISMSSLIGLDPGLTTEGRLHDLGSSSSKDMREICGRQGWSSACARTGHGVDWYYKLLGQVKQAGQLR